MNAILDRILGLIFPQKALVRRLESMSAKEFLKVARRSDFVASFEFPVFPLFSYRDPLVRLAIHEVKYKKNIKICALFAKILQKKIPEELEDEVAFTHFIDPIIIPIPSHPKKLRKKGFNQTVFILEELRQISTFPIHDALAKTKYAGDQTHKNRAERLAFKEQFEVKKEFQECTAGRNIIIFDDVITTGGTLKDARRALKQSGARRVVGMTLAH